MANVWLVWDGGDVVRVPGCMLPPAPGQMSGTVGENLIEIGARGCYESMGVDPVTGKAKGRPTEATLANVLESGHYSVTEHYAITVQIEFPTASVLTRALLALANATVIGDVLGHHLHLQRLVRTLDETGALPTADWEAVAPLGPTLEVVVERLRAHVRTSIELFDPAQPVQDRAAPGAGRLDGDRRRFDAVPCLRVERTHRPAPIRERSERVSRITSRAQLRPLAPVTPPPGCVPAPQSHRSRTGVRYSAQPRTGRRLKSWSNAISP